MIQSLLDRIPGWGGLMYASMSFIIPLFILFINKKLHAKGDPEWKKTNDKKGR